MPDNLLSMLEVAERLDITRQRATKMAREGSLPARKVGRAYVVRESDLPGANAAPATPEEPLLSILEIAQRIGVNRQRAAVLVRSGRIPARQVGHAYVVREADLEGFRSLPAGRPPMSREQSD